MPSQEAPQVELSIVMPCLNEAETLATCIRKAAGFLREYGVSGEIVIGDNGSTDGSQRIARELGARVVPVTKRGYGSAIYHAVSEAAGRYAIVADADDSYDFSRLEPLLGKLREGCDLVVGNRFLGGIRPGAMPWKNRYLGNPVLTAIGRLFFRSPARDFHCGLRGFPIEAFHRMDLRTTGMEFASEMIIKATLLGMSIAEVPVTLDPDGRSRKPHLRPWRDGWRHLRFMLLYSPRWLFLIPGALAMLIGCCGLAGIWVTGRHSHRSMLYASATILAGYQAVLFGVFTRVYAMLEGLLPQDSRVERLFRYIKLEAGLAVGAVFFVVGFAFVLSARLMNESNPHVLDYAIPAAGAVLFGAQTVLASLFLSVMGLTVRTRD